MTDSMATVAEGMRDLTEAELTQIFGGTNCQDLYGYEACNLYCYGPPEAGYSYVACYDAGGQLLCGAMPYYDAAYTCI